MALKVEFLESGIGETILVTFPDGSVGLIDAHPGGSGRRPAIAELLARRRVRFICLTHPHADHAEDLPAAIDASAAGKPAFWHTVTDVQGFLYAIEEEKIHRSPLRDTVAEYRRKSAACLLRAYGKAAHYRLPEHRLRADLQPETIEGVTIHCLGPEEKEQNDFARAFREIVSSSRKHFPDPNHLSAILALEYAGRVVILGADALKRNWQAAFTRWKKVGLARATILKVPHHGAANACDTTGNKHSWFDLCHNDGSTEAVLMAGDAQHPHAQVADALAKRCRTVCTANGLAARRKTFPKSSSLRAAFPFVNSRRSAVPPCHPVVIFEIDAAGNLTRHAGASCDACPVG